MLHKDFEIDKEMVIELLREFKDSYNLDLRDMVDLMFTL